MITGIRIAKDCGDDDKAAYLRSWAGTKPYSTVVTKRANKKRTYTTDEWIGATGEIKGSSFKDGVKLCLKYDGAADHTWAKKSVSRAALITSDD